MATQRSGTLFTYEDYCNMPEDERYELIDGELIMVAAPRRVHQGTSRNISTPLDTYVKGNRLGEMYYAPTDVILSNTNVVQPDILFVSRRGRTFWRTKASEARRTWSSRYFRLQQRSLTEYGSESYTRASVCRSTGRWTSTNIMCWF